MRFVSYAKGNSMGIAIKIGIDNYRGLQQPDLRFPGSLDQLLRAGPPAMHTAAQLLIESGTSVNPARFSSLPPIFAPGKVIRIRPRYLDQSQEVDCEKPACANFNLIRLRADRP
ncbi:hypothetical protein P3T18_000029 [Paraburkholderia sp. GAS199]|uniref:hypothetical protein n=1 Tax=Paraburkholderia sp. GAS199 TaxID=3035126 RepID=UPI003D192771